jgi:hypothetical protein
MLSIVCVTFKHQNDVITDIPTHKKYGKNAPVAHMACNGLQNQGDDFEAYDGQDY